MITTLVILFIIGYILIALEHPIKINKAATALILGMLLWTLYSVSVGNLDKVNDSVLGHMGDITEILFFLIGAMTIVEIVDVHGGFSIVTDHIKTRSKKKLLWQIGVITFLMSSILDNLTTAIVITMLLRKLVSNQRERWLYAAIIIIAANAGGAWSPIGDVTTIMLWVKGNVTTQALCSFVFLPSVISLLIPLICISPMLKGQLADSKNRPVNIPVAGEVGRNEKLTLFCLGVGGLLFVPVFKAFTGLPPFIGMMISLSIIWIYTDLLYDVKKNTARGEYRVPEILKRIDIQTILFFLGILLAVAALQEAGILGGVAHWLDVKLHNIYIIDIILGMLSSIVDNVPLVAASISMYPLHAAGSIPAGPEYQYMMHFVQDGAFWEFLSYCVGVGGSIFIIGSAAGVVVMGLEKMNFVWYMKKISLIALAGYLGGAAVYVLEVMLFKGGL
jgi:Na+/H+ antiporter NhaD/arsenite permease-like protein